MKVLCSATWFACNGDNQNPGNASSQSLPIAVADIKSQLWNVWCLPSLLTDRRSRQRAAAISPLLNDYDIVVLNEAFVHKDLLLSKSAHEYRYIPPKPCLRVFDSGLLFLSKYPISKCAFERYTHTASVDSLVAKGIGFCNIAIIDESGENHGTLQVFGTHMQSERTNAAQAARHEQALQAASFILKNRTADRSPAVFLGDMNMGPKQEGSFSQHYSDECDAEARCAAYQLMVSGCGFEEVQCEDPGYINEICRFVAQNVNDCRLEFVVLRDAAMRRLSDTDPICLTIFL